MAHEVPDEGTVRRPRMRPRVRARSKTIYGLEMTLRESDPCIWRQLLVPASTTLHRLHEILQATMLWLEALSVRWCIPTVRRHVLFASSLPSSPTRPVPFAGPATQDWR